MDKTKRMQINLKLDAQENGHLTREELKSLSDEELGELQKSVSDYLDLIDEVSQEI